MSTPTGSGWEFTVSKMTLDNPSRYEASSLVFPATYAHLKWTRGLKNCSAESRNSDVATHNSSEVVLGCAAVKMCRLNRA